MGTKAELQRDWRHILPAGVRPYTEAAPIAALFLGVSSGFPYAMIGATLTTRLKQDGIDKATITAFTLAFLVYNLKPLWSWLVDGVRLPIIGRLGQRVSWMLLAGVLVIAGVVNLAFIVLAVATKDGNVVASLPCCLVLFVIVSELLRVVARAQRCSRRAVASQ